MANNGSVEHPDATRTLTEIKRHHAGFRKVRYAQLYVFMSEDRGECSEAVYPGPER